MAGNKEVYKAPNNLLKKMYLLIISSDFSGGPEH